MNEAAPVLCLSGITRTFKQGRDELHVLNGLDLTIHAGELVALVGPSGAGKSTLLHIAGLLEKPDAGEVIIGGEPGSKANDETRTRLRRNHIGFVYQYHHLLPEFSARENIIIPQLLAGQKKGLAGKRADELLSFMGLTERASHRPARLSGGEQQRIAIARALANAPNLLLADEPTGNLDPHTADEVFNLLLALVRGAGFAALIATHNLELAAKMDRIVRLSEGRLEEAPRVASVPSD
ncbi:MAG: ABC transporter ATP-binding protein [Rhodospirillales bacterium]